MNTKRWLPRLLLGLGLLLVCLSPGTALASNISGSGFAWGENTGWVTLSRQTAGTCGTVTLSPPGISCSAGTCTLTVNQATAVRATFRALPLKRPPPSRTPAPHR